MSTPPLPFFSSVASLGTFIVMPIIGDTVLRSFSTQSASLITSVGALAAGAALSPAAAVSAPPVVLAEAAGASSFLPPQAAAVNVSARAANRTVSLVMMWPDSTRRVPRGVGEVSRGCVRDRVHAAPVRAGGAVGRTHPGAARPPELVDGPDDGHQ